MSTDKNKNESPLAGIDSPAYLEARIAELEKAQEELKQLKREAAKHLRLKVSKKGGISIYGLNRLPITLYRNQFERLIKEIIEPGKLTAFIKDNEKSLVVK